MGEFREFIEGLEARYNTAHAQTGTPAMINPGGTFSDAPEPGSVIAPHPRGWVTASREWATPGDKAHTPEARGMSLADKMMTECQRETEGALRIRLPVEWRAALVRDGASEIPVTPEMMDAASRCFRAPGLGVNDIPAIYRAMAALAPADPRLGHPTMGSLIDNVRMEQELDAAIRQRDATAEQLRITANRAYITEGRVRELEADLAAARAMLREWPATHDRHMALATAHVSKLADQNSALGATNKRLRDEISAVTVENAALHDALALRPAVTTPKPSGHDPFREFPGDRRRIGG